MRNATAERNGTLSQAAERDEISGNDARGSSQDSSPAQTRPALDARYGQIGISAVAAAARYQGAAKNPAYAPTSNDWRWRLRYAEELS